MPKFVLQNSLDTLSLNGVAENGVGVQVTSGVTGLGLPPTSTQWLEGAGDGATFRRQRVLPRDIDLPLDIVSRDRAHIKGLLSRLAKLLADPATLRMVDEEGTWLTDVVRVGGGTYAYGPDTTGRTDLQMVVTLRAGDPYWTYSKATTVSIGGFQPAAPFISGWMSLPVSPSQAIGKMELNNTGDAASYPVWTVYGPGDTLTLTSPRGEQLRWNASLDAGDKLTIDTRKGTVKLGSANRYADLAPAPRFWTVEPGVSTCTASLLNINSDSRIVCSFRPRKWMVI
jgi:hypothetical protein